MPNLVKIAGGINVAPALAQLDAHPELWDQHTERRDADASPHSEMSDIWLRYRARAELTEPARYVEPFAQSFYPAWYVLTALHPIVGLLTTQLVPEELGGILVTRIPPGGVIRWHDDRGSWHAERMTTKVYVPLRANDRCVNYCGAERAVFKPGSAWTFNNLIGHAVENRGDTERITMIVCMRCADAALGDVSCLGR